MDIKYEHTKFLMQRFDQYYNNVNNKGIFYISLNTFILTGITVGYTSLHSKVEPSFWLYFFLITSLICCLASTLFTILSIHPHSKDNHADDEKSSLIYFGGIAKHKLPFYKEKFHDQTEENIIDGMLQQVHCLAHGLHSKYFNLKIAGYILFAQLGIILPLLFFSVKNFIK